MNSLVHPAIPRLFVMQTVAKTRRLRRGFSTPRRFLLSFVGVLLGAVYASNIAVSVYLREAMAPGRFETFVPLGLLAYVLWDIVKNSCARPGEAVNVLIQNYVANYHDFGVREHAHSLPAAEIIQF